MRMTREEYEAAQKRVKNNRHGRKLSVQPITPPRKLSKYRNRKVEVDGIKFDSQKEADRYLANKARIASGELQYQLLQVPFRLPGGTRYICDFMEVDAKGRIRFVDTKGFQTAMFKLKEEAG